MNRRSFSWATISLLAVAWLPGPDRAGFRAAAQELTSPPELGRVHFRRGYDAAVMEAKKLDRPLLILFQEIPGCATCVTYGERVLGHYLVAEAAETLFVPLVVVNNAPGDDARVLKLFNEPPNSNPVVRIFAPSGAELAPRLADNYALPGLTAAMIAALNALSRPVPEYLQLLHEEAAARAHGVERAMFGMASFRECEPKLGGIRGVLSTTPGTFRNAEVIELEFDPRAIDYGKLLRAARNMDCATQAYTRSDQHHVIASGIMGGSIHRTVRPMVPAAGHKPRLRGTPYQHLPMTLLQSVRVHHAVAVRQDPARFLSPRQLAILERVKAHPDADWPVALDIPTMSAAWQAIDRVIAQLDEDS